MRLGEPLVSDNSNHDRITLQSAVHYLLFNLLLLPCYYYFAIIAIVTEMLL